jgi:O-antigen ligase
VPYLSRLRFGALFFLCIAVIVAALILGGGARSGYLSDIVLQLLALPLLIAGLWRLSQLPSEQVPKGALTFCAALVLLPLVQLIPLPPAVWAALPNRQPVTEVFALLGRDLPWLPISISPTATWLSALSLLVPISIFVGTSLLDYRERRWLSLVIIGVTLVSIFLGLGQVSQSLLLVSDVSTPSEAVGFFANRNHFAALLYSVTLFAAVWTLEAALAVGVKQRQSIDATTIVAVLASFTVLVMLVAGQMVARSRAGLGLTIVALAGAFILAWADERRPKSVTPAKILGASIALALLFATQFALYRMMERFTADPLQDARIAFARTTTRAAMSFMPTGSGLGTFVPVYAMFEKPEDILANTYVNRAHNDFLELWLEAGLLGLALMAVFAVWFVSKSISVWGASYDDTPPCNRSLARAATIMIGLLIAHSLLDYPLRTGAMMAILAFACALLVEPPAPSGGTVAEQENAAEHSAPTGSGLMPPTRHEDGFEQRPRVAGQRWGENIEWPEEWRTPSEPRKPGRK